MIFVFGEAKEFRRLIAPGGIKGMEIVAWTFLNKSELGQKFRVKAFCYSHVFYPQIDVIKATRFHFAFANFRFARRTTSFNPDQVSSTAHTFTSTNPSGSATERITSSVTSPGTPADFFGHETQSVPLSGKFFRRRVS